MTMHTDGYTLDSYKPTWTVSERYLNRVTAKDLLVWELLSTDAELNKTECGAWLSVDSNFGVLWIPSN